MVDITIVFMGVISWFINQQTSHGGPILWFADDCHWPSPLGDLVPEIKMCFGKRCVFTLHSHNSRPRDPRQHMSSGWILVTLQTSLSPTRHSLPSHLLGYHPGTEFSLFYNGGWGTRCWDLSRRRSRRSWKLWSGPCGDLARGVHQPKP